MAKAKPPTQRELDEAQGKIAGFLERIDPDTAYEVVAVPMVPAWLSKAVDLSRVKAPKGKKRAVMIVQLTADRQSYNLLTVTDYAFDVNASLGIPND